MNFVQDIDTWSVDHYYYDFNDLLRKFKLHKWKYEPISNDRNMNISYCSTIINITIPVTVCLLDLENSKRYKIENVPTSMLPLFANMNHCMEFMDVVFADSDGIIWYKDALYFVLGKYVPLSISIRWDLDDISPTILPANEEYPKNSMIWPIVIPKL